MNKITGRELDPNQFPAWAEFTPSGEALTKVSPRAGFEIEVLIDQVSDGVTTKAMARVGAGIIESGYVSGRGWYVKFSDGTMIETIENTLSATAAGEIVTTGAFPVPFYTQPSGLIAPHSCSAGMVNMVAIKGAGPYNGLATIWYSRVNVNTSSYVILTGVFVGRWKA